MKKKKKNKSTKKSPKVCYHCTWLTSLSTWLSFVKERDDTTAKHDGTFIIVVDFLLGRFACFLCKIIEIKSSLIIIYEVQWTNTNRP